MTAPARALQPMNRALITGITGQDGSYLAELLLVRLMLEHDLRDAGLDPAERIVAGRPGR